VLGERIERTLYDLLELLNYFHGDDLLTTSERRRGIPIGNQTSQFFANVYLDPLDHFLKDRLGIKGYVRYVDDFLVFSDDKRHLADVREGIRARCRCETTRGSGTSAGQEERLQLLVA
jgi:hypothetical protein